MEQGVNRDLERRPLEGSRKTPARLSKVYDQAFGVRMFSLPCYSFKTALLTLFSAAG